MLTPRTLSIGGLALCATAAAGISPVLGRQVAAAPAGPQVRVIGHANAVHLLTLRITGSHFVPGSRVGIAIMDSRRWRLLATGATSAQRATMQVICGHDFQVCTLPNPKAGTIDYRVHLRSARPVLLMWTCGHDFAVCTRPDPRVTAELLVLYRAVGDAHMRSVTLQ